jgi:hypothetical protein
VVVINTTALAEQLEVTEFLAGVEVVALQAAQVLSLTAKAVMEHKHLADQAE